MPELERIRRERGQVLIDADSPLTRGATARSPRVGASRSKAAPKRANVSSSSGRSVTSGKASSERTRAAPFDHGGKDARLVEKILEKLTLRYFGTLGDLAPARAGITMLYERLKDRLDDAPACRVFNQVIITSNLRREALSSSGREK